MRSKNKRIRQAELTASLVKEHEGDKARRRNKQRNDEKKHTGKESGIPSDSSSSSSSEKSKGDPKRNNSCSSSSNKENKSDKKDKKQAKDTRGDKSNKVGSKQFFSPQGLASTVSSARDFSQLRHSKRILGDAILVSHGSFNPIHRGHIQMLVIARKRLEIEGYNVVAGYLGITTTSHIRDKGSPAMCDDLRLRCINLLISEVNEPWIKGDARGIEFRNSDSMAKSLLEGHPEATAFSVKGADLAEKYGVEYGAPTIWVGRSGFKLPAEGRGPSFSAEADLETGDFSSTKLREVIPAEDTSTLKWIAGDSVANLLIQGDLWIP